MVTHNGGWLVVKHFQDTRDGCLLYVRIKIQNQFSQSGKHTVHVIRRPERTQISQGQSSDLTRSMFTIFLKSVDGHDWQIGVIFCVCRQVKVNHFFHDFIVHKRGSTHLRENWGCVHTERHVADDFFNDLSALFSIIGVDDPWQETKLRIWNTI